MILTARQIKERQDLDIVIRPWEERLLNPNSYNLRLDSRLVAYTVRELDMARDNPYETIDIPPEGYVLEPGRLYLGRTVEYTETFNLVPMLEGRSSIGRLGMFVHITAGFGDIGFRGFWTLEIVAVQPIRIYAGVEICQIFYHTVDTATIDARREYRGKYQGNQGIQTSQLFRDLAGPRPPGSDEVTQ